MFFFTSNKHHSSQNFYGELFSLPSEITESSQVMGNTDSIPLVSQVKSLVQVIGGDADGAKKTQENFARTGILASQINSLVHSISGNNTEAKRIQEEFGHAQFDIAKSLPVVGHGIAAGYAIGGDTEKAENI